MNIWINTTDSRPIYEQIAAQIKAQILSQQLQAGEALPSLRLLAKELRVSVITTKRAYEELERAGFLQTIAGKGCFVAPQSSDQLRQEALQSMKRALQQAVQAAREAGISDKEILSSLSLLLEGTL